ncbi:MAG TPA: hypothetical protein VIY07_18660 [Pseudolabrys sp.]
MFGKKAFMDDLGRNLNHARQRRDALVSKRDALASDVTALDAQIAEFEARLTEEKDRRERERVVGEIEGIKKRLKDAATAFAPSIVGLCNATEAAGAVVPEARELNSFLLSVATEVDIVIDSLLCELQRQTEAMCAGNAAVGTPQLLNTAPEPAKNNDRLLLLPAWLRRSKETGKKESAEDRFNTAA